MLTEPVSGHTFVESSRFPGVLYRVTPDGCSCAAGTCGVPCMHRACYLAQISELPLDETPAPALLPVATERCISCSNGRVEEWGVSGPIGWTACEFCQGHRQVSVTPALATMPVASPARVAA